MDIGKVLQPGVLAAAALAALATPLAAIADESPYATGGEITTIDLGNFRKAYIHTFTNTDEVATFASTGRRDLTVRYLVVGAGGAGGYYYSNSTYGGGGGGGGGVCEKDGIFFPANAMWQVRVGKGAADYKETAGASSISNGVADVETVPGGGNGASAVRPAAASGAYANATSGATGGGGIRADGYKAGGAGTYPSATLMDTPEADNFNGGTVVSTRAGAAGGGAGAAATNAQDSTHPGTAGEGVRSDITGETLFYGSGGGGGSGQNGATYFQGTAGGTRAGNGGVRNADETTVTSASHPVPNSGCGGGGGSGFGSSDEDHRQTGGADGIVIIRYDIAESPCAGGDIVTRTLKKGTTYTYIHTFTNSAEAAEFVNVSGREINNIRYLVVGAGGAGGRPGSTSFGGGGGGGGGVCEAAGVSIAAGAVWTVVVGKGATTYDETAGGSSITNGVNWGEAVSGGGNGASDKNSPTTGAAGGGGQRDVAGGEDVASAGALGNYPSSIFGVVPEGAPFAGGSASGTRYGGAGGGASGDGSAAGGRGRGLQSDITGCPLTYGAGGGGGCGRNVGNKDYYNGGHGGDVERAGCGGMFEGQEYAAHKNLDEQPTAVGATPPAANSGCGGGGAASWDNTNPTGGADGIVIIRYDFNENPQGLMMIVR